MGCDAEGKATMTSIPRCWAPKCIGVVPDFPSLRNGVERVRTRHHTDISLMVMFSVNPLNLVRCMMQGQP
jgi:hypothetical protein